MNEQSSYRYDIDSKSNRFMEFVSREMMRSKRNRSYAEQPRHRTNVLIGLARARSLIIPLGPTAPSRPCRISTRRGS